MNIDKSENRKDRSIETLFAYPEAAVINGRGETATPRLSVYTYHDKDRKVIVSRIDRNMRIGNVVRSLITYGQDNFPEGITRRVGLPVARYSAKALEAAHAAALDAVESLPFETLSGLHAWAADASKDPGMTN